MAFKIKEGWECDIKLFSLVNLATMRGRVVIVTPTNPPTYPTIVGERAEGWNCTEKNWLR